jgi:MFS family permease
MKRTLPWRGLLAINVHWLGISTVTGSITPILMPYLIALFVPDDRKNTYLATVRVASLAVAMAIQPMAGLLSDRSTLPWGRRRPFVLMGTTFTILSLLVIGLSSHLGDSVASDGFAPLAYLVLFAGIVLWQASSNLGQGALQGLIPDLVPENERGRASGVKATMEVLAALPLVALGPLVDRDSLWPALGVLAALLSLTTLITVRFVHEDRPGEIPSVPADSTLGRMVLLALLFVGVTQAAVWLVRASSRFLAVQQAGTGAQVIVVGLTGLAGMAGSVFLGVYLGARIGIGRQATSRAPFIWWIINRLLFFAAAGSIQGFILYFLRDVHHIANVATTSTFLLAVVAAFLTLSAIAGGYLADRIGYRRLIFLSSLAAAAGTYLLVVAPGLPLLFVSGSILGIGAGVFWATNWALGTRLVPPTEAGRYLGIANLAGAGAGIVGAGIGGPMADFFNTFRPGLGYQVIFSLYGVLFLLSAAALSRVTRGD